MNLLKCNHTLVLEVPYLLKLCAQQVFISQRQRVDLISCVGIKPDENRVTLVTPVPVSDVLISA